MYKYSKNIPLCYVVTAPKNLIRKHLVGEILLSSMNILWFAVCKELLGARSFTRVHIAILNEGTNCPTFALRFLSISTLPPFAAINVPDINGWTIYVKEHYSNNISHIYLFLE